jgi:hypothetical protein
MRVMAIDFSKPLPDHFFTRGRAVIMGLAVGVTVAAGLLGYGWVHRRVTEPAQPPDCYWPRLANYTPGNDSLPLRGARERDGFVPHQRDQRGVEDIKQAEAVCKPEGCTGEAWKAYRSALFWYLAERQRRTRQLDERYGDAGLRLAGEIYDTAADRQVELGLRVRYRAGVFRINDFRPGRDGNREAIAILVLKGGAALRPCSQTAARGGKT